MHCLKYYLKIAFDVIIRITVGVSKKGKTIIVYKKNVYFSIPISMNQNMILKECGHGL